MMKNRLLITLFAILTLGSCENLEDFNKNPNNVSETHPQLLLTTIEWNAFQVEGVDPLMASRMLVMTDGENENQFYKWNRNDFGDYEYLRNVVKLMDEGKRISSANYQALAKFFRAFYFYKLTLTFGDIPYSEALQGESTQIFTPKYDSQKEVFLGILKELKEANELLTDDIIEGDIIFNGNASKWQKLINSFRLKVLLTLSRKTTDNDLNVKQSFADIAANNQLMESNNDNAKLVFLDQLGSRYTEYNNSAYGSARYVDSTFIKRLQEREDPRLFIFCGQTRNAKEAGLGINDFNAYEGGNPIAPYNEVNLKAAAGNVSKVNLRYTGDPTCEPHMILSYSELQLILAEARVRGWISSSDAETYYKNGVAASFKFYYEYAKGYSIYVDDAAVNDYQANSFVDFSNAVNDEEKIERIIMQKYLASFLQGGWSMYFDHLRTGYPSFLILPGITPPTRWMYPTSENQINSVNVSNAISIQFGEGKDNISEIPWWLQ